MGVKDVKLCVDRWLSIGGEERADLVMKFALDPEDRGPTSTLIDTVVNLGSERGESEC